MNCQIFHILVLDLITEDYKAFPDLLPPVFCICNKRDGLFTLTMLFTSVSLACIRATFDLTALYLNVMDCLITSSEDATKSSESSSINLYSIFYMKSRVALPSLCMTKTERKL